jgi:ADP-heptose:LPS heptosyltransferase
LRGVLLRHSVGAQRVVAWQKRPLEQTLAVRLGGARYHARCHIAARYHAAVEELVGQMLPRQALRYVVDAPSRDRAMELLRDAGVRVDIPIIGMAPGAMWETKRWPPERFGALAAWAFANGMQVVLTGSSSERDVTRQVLQVAPQAVDLAGKLELDTLAGVIDRCEVFVANDSGPMHMARALGVPTLALFGSTDPGQFDFTGHALMFAGVSCSPCSFHGLPRCPRGHLHCLLDLDVERARKALQSLLSRGRAAYVMG